MRRLIAGPAARDLVAKALPPSNRGRGFLAPREWFHGSGDGVSRAEPSAADLAALANLAEPWWEREAHDPLRDQTEAQAEVEALVRAAGLSPSEADAVALLARGVTVAGIARAKGISRQAVHLAVANAIRKMQPPTEPLNRVSMATFAKKKSRSGLSEIRQP